MNGMKRLASRITSSFEWVVRQVENHDALVTATIQEVTQSAAAAKVQLKSVRKDGKKIREKIHLLELAVAQWEERARSSKEKDEERAIECLKRKRINEKELSELQEEERRQTALEKSLAEELRTVERHLDQLKRQRNIMRTRQSRATAMQSISANESQLVSELDDIFERWDMKITEYEMKTDLSNDERDDLEEEFTEQEERAQLLEELQNL